jgi:dynein heavy chain
VNQRRDADETQKQVTAKSQRIAEEQKECKKLEELARADLATVEPALNEAIKVVNESFSENISQFQTKLMIALFFLIFSVYVF